MREPPQNLTEEQLCRCLIKQYHLVAPVATFLPLGYDSAAWVYRVESATHEPLFVKVRLGGVNLSTLLLPLQLQAQGVTQVVPPMPTSSGAFWADLGVFKVIVYPFIAGDTAMKVGLTPAQWIAYGALMRRIHAATPPAGLLAETFVPDGAALVRRLDRHIDVQQFTEPIAQEMCRFWLARRKVIQQLLRRAEELGRRVVQSAPAFVLCHADLHTGNLLVDQAGQLWVVDWDEAILAPRERDLFFVLGGGISRDLVSPAAEQSFRQGYGLGPIHENIVLFYRYSWAISDIAAFGDDIFFRPDFGLITREAALASVQDLFRPGQIVELALSSDDLTLGTSDA